MQLIAYCCMHISTQSTNMYLKYYPNKTINESMKGSVSFTGGSQYTYNIKETKLAYQHNYQSIVKVKS